MYLKAHMKLWDCTVPGLVWYPKIWITSEVHCYRWTYIWKSVVHLQQGGGGGGGLDAYEAQDDNGAYP